MLIHNTPVEEHVCGGVRVLVKREDLCCPLPGPPFSKMRGVVAHIKSRPEKVIGVLDTFHSKAGWAVAYACSVLGKSTINYWPCYKGEDPKAIREPQQRSSALGAALVSLKAGRSAMLYHEAKKDLATAPFSYMMPNALKLSESVYENAREAAITPLPCEGSIVISISSGTVAAGVLLGMQTRGYLSDYDVHLHMGYSRPLKACERYIVKSGCLILPHLNIVDEGYEYADKVDVDVPFPCNAWYDAKAWLWLTRNIRTLRQPVVFWNIGA